MSNEYNQIASMQPNPGQAHRFLYSQAPLLVYWEATQSCDLACIHCRAEAVPYRHPLELDTEEVQALFRQIAGFGGRRLPHLVITGGDPLKRPDIFQLIAYARGLGLTVSITPAGTPLLTVEIVRRLQASGISSLALSLDGSNPTRHDAFRGVEGSYQWTTDAARCVRQAHIPLQINTMVTAQTLDDIPAIFQVVKGLDIVRWALFFLITTGRGQALAEVDPQQGEELLTWLTQLSGSAGPPFTIKTTEAHHFRRVMLQQRDRRSPTTALSLSRQAALERSYGIRDGNGIVFISSLGQVFPSGFLPLVAGNVRHSDLVEVYQNHPLFQSLRAVDNLKGKCGICPFRHICGGSRARAYAATGDPLESDPLCPYQPRLAQAERPTELTRTSRC